MHKENGAKNIDNNEKGGHNDDPEVTFEDAIDETGNEVLAQKLKKAKEELQACIEERKEYLDGWQRAKADFVNARKRSEEDRAASLRSVQESLVLSILPVLDSFEMAFENGALYEHVDKSWVQGMRHIQNQLVNILKEHGVEAVFPVGERFEPATHDSIESRDVDDTKKDGVIIAVAQKGYMMNGRLLRAPKVIVGRHKKS